jgi:hypothetical protein
MPRSIRRFELLWYVSLILLFVHFVLAALTQGFTQQQQQDVFVGSLVVLLAMGGIVWLAARRRKNWARWMLLGLHLVFWAVVLTGTTLLLWRNWAAIPAATFLLIGIRLVALLMQAAALALAFAEESEPWFRRKPMPFDFA